MGRWGKYPKIRMLNYGNRMQKYHERYLKVDDIGLSFDMLITPYYGLTAIYYVNELKKHQQDLQVLFYEEGLLLFREIGRMIPYLTGYFPHGSNDKERLINRLAEKPRIKRCRKNAQSVIYTYAPEMLQEEAGLTAYKLPGCQDNPCTAWLLQDLAAQLPDLLERYEKRNVYYIANHLVPGLEDSYNISYSVIEAILQCFGKDKLIIKAHPSSTAHKLEYARQYEAMAYVDRQDYFPEAVFSNISNLRQKLFVCRMSTLPFNLCNWFGAEPYVIFTYRLFPYFANTGDPSAENNIELLKHKYKDPSRIMVPSSFHELRSMLRLYKARLYGIEPQDLPWGEYNIDLSKEEICGQRGTEQGGKKH